LKNVGLTPRTAKSLNRYGVFKKRFYHRKEKKVTE